MRDEIIRDIKIAQTAIEDSPIYISRRAEIIRMEIYCLPSHNHYAFYLQECEDKDGKVFCRYARTEIYDLVLNSTINMYPFRYMAGNQCSSYGGRIVCGIFDSKHESMSILRKIADALPDASVISCDANMLVMDGTIHWIKIDGKEYLYTDAKNIVASEDKMKIDILDYHNELLERYF